VTFVPYSRILCSDVSVPVKNLVGMSEKIEVWFLMH